MKRLNLKWKIEPDSGCWLWQGSTVKGGYGHLTFRRKHYLAHRFSYELHIRKLVPGETLHHKCRNVLCGNPAHLEPKLNADHVREERARQRLARTHCKKGHKLSATGVMIQDRGRGWNGVTCGVCLRENGRKRAMVYRRRKCARMQPEFQSVLKAHIKSEGSELPTEVSA